MDLSAAGGTAANTKYIVQNRIVEQVVEREKKKKHTRGHRFGVWTVKKFYFKNANHQINERIQMTTNQAKQVPS